MHREFRLRMLKIPEQITPPDYAKAIVSGVIAVIVAVALVGIGLFLALRKR